MSLSRKDRTRIYFAMDGRCGYCGEKIDITQMQIDHMHPKEHGGADDDSNLMCACRPCNNFKSVFSVETFRMEVSRQIERARKYSVNFRTAERFGLLVSTPKPVVFYFEARLREEIEDCA